MLVTTERPSTKLQWETDPWETLPENEFEKLPETLLENDPVHVFEGLPETDPETQLETLQKTLEEWLPATQLVYTYNPVEDIPHVKRRLPTILK